MRRKYWKVHKDDLHLFECVDGVSQSQILAWKLECTKHNDYVYINEHGIFSGIMTHSFMPFKKESIEYYKSRNYIYMGSFNLKRSRKEKLEKIYEKNL